MWNEVIAQYNFLIGLLRYSSSIVFKVYSLVGFSIVFTTANMRTLPQKDPPTLLLPLHLPLYPSCKQPLI